MSHAKRPVCGARLSADEVYRYVLWREWGPGKRVLWVMLNPSTADAYADDATIRKCMSFSKKWGYGSLEVVNLFALRSRDPKLLSAHPDPVGPDNDATLRDRVRRNDLVVAAWGSSLPKEHVGRADYVMNNLLVSEGIHCLGRNADGQPKHPLYVKGSTTPIQVAA